MKHNILGQHFLKSHAPVELMIQSAKEEKSVDLVLEIGSGKGILTRELIKNFQKVVAVEKDRRLAEELKRKLEVEKVRNCEVIISDVRRVGIEKIVAGKKYSVIANIPYYLTSRLIRIFLESDRQPAYMILMIQKEVAERIIAKPPHMSLLSLSVQAYGKPKVIGSVSKKEFSPEPKVDSAIIKISGISKNFFKKNKITEESFFRILRTAFSQKRKQLVNTLGEFYSSKRVAAEKLKTAGIPLAMRPQELDLAGWLRLAKLKA